MTPRSLLGNGPSSQQSGFGSDFTFPHTPLQQSRDNNLNILPFRPPVGAGSLSAAPQNIFTTTTWKSKDSPCFHGKSAEDAHTWVAMVPNCFVFMAGTTQQEVAYAATPLRALHRSCGLAICRGIMGNTPVIGILWCRPFWSDLARTLMQRRLRPNCSTSHREADLCARIQLSSSCTWNVLRFLMYVVSFDNSFGDWRNLWQKSVTLKYPKTIHAAIGHAEAIELTGLTSKRPRGTFIARGGAQSSHGGVKQRGAGGMQ